MCKGCCLGLIKFGTFLQPFFLVLIRVFWGILLLQTGLGKFYNLESVAAFFTSLHIPLPLVCAYLVAFIETVGGLFIVIGLIARFVSIFITIVMITALFTAHLPAIQVLFINPLIFSTQAPVPFLMMSLIILASALDCFH